MKEKLFKNAIEVRKSSIQGYGVFATRNIKQGEMIEQCHFILPDQKTSEFYNYLFLIQDDTFIKKSVLLLGYGSIYNHSERPNAEYYYEYDATTILFKAKTNIIKDEEILISYGENWFNNRGIKIVPPTKPKSKLIPALLRLSGIVALMLVLYVIHLPSFTR